jgi:Na+/glutamate symporter
MPMEILLNAIATFVVGVMVLFIGRWLNRQR